MGIIKRDIQKNIENALFKGKIIILYGARQVGKTTLVQEIAKKYPDTSVYLNCDEPDIRAAFTHATSTSMRAFIGTKRLVFLDEAQRVSDIGISLKLLIDTAPELQIVATGSSSFELANKTVESLTGRKREFFLPPISLHELAETVGTTEARRLLERRIIDGMYPEVVTKGAMEAQETLREITRSYLYRDILEHQRIVHPDVLEKLLQALALQIGNEVSLTELSSLVGINRKTIERYIDLLEKSFVVFRLAPLSRNPRKEIATSRKIYFYDTGIRNALIGNFHALSIRQDTGALWENFAISERWKSIQARERDVRRYFWRTYAQQEIDYIEEEDGQLSGFEMKWREGTYRPPKNFRVSYPDAPVRAITPAALEWLFMRDDQSKNH